MEFIDKAVNSSLVRLKVLQVQFKIKEYKQKNQSWSIQNPSNLKILRLMIILDSLKKRTNNKIMRGEKLP